MNIIPRRSVVVLLVLGVVGCSPQQPQPPVTSQVAATPSESATETASPTASAPTPSTTSTPTDIPTALPTETDRESADFLSTILTNADAEEILGERNLTIQSDDRGEWNDASISYTGTVTEGGGHFNTVIVQTRSTGDLGTWFKDAKRETSMIDGGTKALPNLGQNAFAYWSGDDYTGGTHCGVMWDEGGVTYEIAAIHIVPSKTIGRIVTVAEAGHSRRHS